MKSIKKLKSYSKTVAGTALLLGATVAGGAAFATAQDSGSSGDATLGDYPAPFVDEDGNVATNIVVGEDAKTADVVGAIDVAGSLGNAAFAEETVSGDSQSVNGAELATGIGSSVTATTLDASDYDMFSRENVEDEDGDEHFVVETADVTSNVATQLNGTEAQTTIGSSGAVSYSVSYTPGYHANDTIQMLGEEYEVTDVSDTDGTVDLGSTMEETGLVVGDSYEHGPYTVEVVDKDESNSAIFVRVSEGENVLKSKGLSSGESISVNDGDFVVDADSVFFGSSQDYIDLSSTYTDTVLENGEDAPVDEDYTVSLSTSSGSPDTVTGITLNSKLTTASNPDEEDDEVAVLEDGDSFEGPAEYFDVTQLGFSDEADETVEVDDGEEVTFTDYAGFEQTIDLDSTGFLTDDSNAGYDLPSSEGDAGYIDVAGRPVHVEVTNTDVRGASEVVLSYETWDMTVDGTSTQETTGYGFTIDAQITDGDSGTGDSSDDDETELSINSVSVTGDAPNVDGASAEEDGSTASGVLDEGATDFDTPLNNEIEYAAGGGTNSEGAITVTANGQDLSNTFGDDADTLAVHYDSSDNVVSVGDGSTADAYTGDSGDEARSTYGSVVEQGSSGADLTVPENQLAVEHAFGEVTEGSGDTTTQTPTGWPSSAALDSEVTSSDRENSNMILVGGPAVNTLTAELADEGMTWNASQYESNQDVGVLDLVNGAFSEGNSALVVAGHQADDTRAAAEFISNYQEHSEDLADQTTVQVSTENNQVVE
jgi:hypothetical protein